jgi:hypothetical protein
VRAWGDEEGDMRYKTNVFEFHRGSDGHIYKKYTGLSLDARICNDVTNQIDLYANAIGAKIEYEYRDSLGRYVTQLNDPKRTLFWIMDTIVSKP